jgi:hypothetical protein
MKWSTSVKLLLAFAGFAAAVAGFMIKLPAVFRHMDKEMHALFYFTAAAGLNILFAGKNLIRHVALFACLYLFGMAIEYAQEYSNTFFHKKIHGRYDPEDIRWNLKGLLAFSAIWITYTAAALLVARLRVQPAAGITTKK